MPRQPIVMFSIKDILRLHYEAGRTQREISRATGVSQSAIQRLLGRARQAGLGWPLAQPAASDAELHAQLYPPAAGPARHSQPDFAQVQDQLRRFKRVTLEQLWNEYCAASEPGRSYSYSQFCALYQQWRASQDVVLHHEHVAGEQLFIDYAGDTATVYEPAGSWQAQLFVAVLGLSAYTYAEACRGQDLESFLRAHVNALHFFGGVPRVFVPDNLKAAVSAADRYEPHGQPQLRRTGATLRRRRAAGETAEAARQSGRGGGRAGGGARVAHAAVAAAAPLPQPGRVERGAAGGLGGLQRQAVPKARGLAPERVRQR